MNFDDWYKNTSKTYGLDPNPKDWEHFYDYEGAFNAGIMGPDEETGHWPSEYKHDFHPNRFIDQGDGSFLDSKNGTYVDSGLVMEVRMQADDFRKEKALESLQKGEDRFLPKVGAKVL